MGDGIDGDGGRARRSRAARARTLGAMKTCDHCKRRSVMARHVIEYVGVLRVCRYCKHEHVRGAA